MELNPLTQLAQAMGSIFFGGVLGLGYDMLRTLRRVTSLPKAAADGLFCLGALAGLFWLGMDLGQGQLRIFMELFALLGTGLYLGCVSPFLLPALTKIAKTLILPIKLAKNLCKKVNIFSKKFFQSHQKWFRIILSTKFLPARENPRDTISEGDEHLYGTQNRYDRKAASAGGSGLCSAEPDKSVEHRGAGPHSSGFGAGPGELPAIGNSRVGGAGEKHRRSSKR